MTARHLLWTATIGAACLLAAWMQEPRMALAQGQPLVRLGPCPQGFLPVCAMKQKALVTYVNACAARGVNARVITADRGCIDGCPRDYAPVCATDGTGQRRVFGNTCEAEKSGATDIRTGTCRRVLRRVSSRGGSVGAPVP
jgi:hypothetical protein